MGVFSICIIGVVGALLAICIKNVKPEYSALISIAICILMIISIVGRLSYIVEYLEIINEYLNLDNKYVLILLKMIGITYLSEFAADICKDTGHSAIATQIQVFGKISILAVSMPVFTNLIDTIDALL
ncbi:MAG: stage III sporulation protein AD [Lachnospiraceae bacterium]|nr:stage III sporulation protein AD [Lachnospiraceae bacterium]MBQ4068698.1 stage III sporulation protein AD [Lachnospiraceae bacterium]